MIAQLQPSQATRGDVSDELMPLLRLLWEFAAEDAAAEYADAGRDRSTQRNAPHMVTNKNRLSAN